MTDFVTLGLGLLQIVAQLIAVYFAYRVTRTTGAFIYWTLIVIALVLMTVRRVTALLIQAGSLPALSGVVSYTDQIILPLAISLFLLAGIYGLVRTFERQSKNTRRDTSDQKEQVHAGP